MIADEGCTEELEVEVLSLLCPSAIARGLGCIDVSFKLKHDLE